MKILISKRFYLRGLTIPEIVITGTLGIMVMGGILTLQLVGTRMFQITKTKLGGNDDARQAIGKLVADVRSAKMVKVGTGSLSTFSECGVNQQQIGNAIQVYPTSNTNNFVRYFKNTDNRLHRTTNGAASDLILANFVTNSLVFTAENYKGQVLTNNENNRVIALTLQFYQIQYPVVRIGTNELYDFYQVRTKITRRVLE
jgi:hypothetical protein